MSVWKKYMSIINILLKKASAEEQVLATNRMDFEKITGSKKSGYSFIIKYANGKADTAYSSNQFIQAFMAALQCDEPVYKLLKKNDYMFTFTSKFQLLIKNNLRAATEVTEPESEEALAH